MQNCPKCNSAEVHRSRARTRWETWRREITGKRPFRCPQCGWRGWGIDTDPKFDEADVERALEAIAPTPPNLKRVSLALDELRVDDVDLKALDDTDSQQKRNRRARQ